MVELLCPLMIDAPAGALPKKPKKRKPVTLNVSLDSKGKLTK